MKYDFIIHDTYGGFLSRHNPEARTANPKGALVFKSYFEASNYGLRMQGDEKLSTGNWHVLALPVMS